MSVIGRLDKQVDEVLIAPVEKNRRKASQAGRDIPNPNETSEVNDQPADEKDAERKELPVWLL